MEAQAAAYTHLAVVAKNADPGQSQAAAVSASRDPAAGAAGAAEPAGAVEGLNDFGKVGYGG